MGLVSEHLGFVPEKERCSMFLVRPWWSFVLRGVLAIAFGAAIWFLPGMALLTLIILFGVLAFADGAVHLAAAMRGGDEDDERSQGALVLRGVLGLVTGLIALFLPGVTALALVYIIAGWAIVIGIFEIVAAIRLRKSIRNEWILAFAGVLSLAFGLLLAIAPGAGALAMMIWIGAYAVAMGVMLIAVGWKLRRWSARTIGHGPPTHAAPI
jgi:uncharacterized membrane protein HdeD (DUF308 family)